MNDTDTVDILSVRVNHLNVKQLLTKVEQFIRFGRRYTILYVNIHCMNLAMADGEYKRILNSASLVYCDGEGVRLGARILGYNLPTRMTGADWIYNLARFCEERSISLFFLGAEPSVAKTAAEKLKLLFPRLMIAGTFHGYFDKINCQEVLKAINSASPDILLVGLGSPLQEKWIYQYRDKIEVPVCWAVGALFDFVSGKNKRASQWMLNCGLEWSHRLISEPSRLWRRYLIGNTVFMYRIFKEKLKNRK